MRRMAHSARWLSVLIGCFAVAGLQGCTGSGRDFRSLATIGPGMTRSEVEEKTGQPAGTVKTPFGSISSYQVVIDTNETKNLPTDFGGCVGGCAMAYLLIAPITIIVDQVGVSDETIEIAVAYSPDDRVVGSSFTGTGGRELKELLKNYSMAQGGDPEAQYLYAPYAQKEMQEEWYRRAATQGHAGAQYELAQRAPNGSSNQRHWLCEAGQQGYARAQFSIGHLFATGEGKIEQNLVNAYLWYNVASSNGYTWEEYYDQEDMYVKTDQGMRCCKSGTAFSRLLERMTPTELAEAKKMAAQWKPDASECEQELTASSNP